MLNASSAHDSARIWTAGSGCSEDGEVSSPAKPNAEKMVIDMAGHPHGYYICQHAMDLLESGKGINDEVVNFGLGLLQLEASSTVSQDNWTFLTSLLWYRLMK